MSDLRSDNRSVSDSPFIRLHSVGLLRGHMWETCALRFSPDSLLLAAASDQAPLTLWDISSHRKRAILDTLISWSSQLAFASTQPVLAVPNSDSRQVHVYRTDDGAQQAVLVGHHPLVCGVAFLPSGQHLLTVDGTGIARLWDWAAGQLLATITVLPETDRSGLNFAQGVHPTIQRRAQENIYIYGLALDPSGETMIVNGYHPDGLLQRWRIDPSDGTARLVERYLLPDSRDFVREQRFSFDGRLLAVLITTYHQAGEGPPLHERIEVYRTAPFGLMEIIQPPLGERWGQINDVAFSPDTRYLAVAEAGGETFDEQGTLWIWDFAARQFVMSQQVHPDPGDNQVWSVKAVDWSATGTHIATAGWEPSERGDMTIHEHLADQLVVKLWHVEANQTNKS